MLRKEIHRWLVILSLSCWLLATPSAFAQDAVDILDKAAAAYEASNGISATFALHTHSESLNAGESYEGMIQMRGDKFVFETPDMITWFDGKTQWTYVERTEEVNVTTPSGDELRFTNPALLISSYKKDFTATYKGESTASTGKTAYDVELIPKKKGDITTVVLQIEKYENFPTRIDVTAKNGIHTTVRISQLKKGVNQPDAFFVFNAADYPNAEVIDLR